jgi:hypothetical protein
MAIHVVIVKQPYLRAILAGRKTIECRLSKQAVPPFGQVVEGERLFIKASGGPFGATALVRQVDSFEGLGPDEVDALRGRYNAAVCGDDDYWQKKRHSVYGTFVHLGAVEPLDVGPSYTKSPYKGWFVLDERYSPLMEVTLTAGAIRNSYLRLPVVSPQLHGAAMTLYLPDGGAIETQMNGPRLIRWRGWGRYYWEYNLQPGDRVRLVALGDRRYRVSFHRQS